MLSALCDTKVTFRPSDIEEEQLVAMFLDGGCGCTKWKGQNCIRQCARSDIQESRSQCQQLSWGELDMLIMGKLVAFGNTGDKSIEWRHAPTPRTRIHYSYHHQGKIVCLKTFLFLHAIGIKRLKNIAKSFQENGFLPRVHGNLKRMPHHCLSLASVQHVITFLVNYTEENSSSWTTSRLSQQ